MKGMTFQERKAQLEALLCTEAGCEKIIDIFRGGAFWDGTIGPVNATFRQIKDMILEREYPKEYAQAQS